MICFEGEYSSFCWIVGMKKVSLKIRIAMMWCRVDAVATNSFAALRSGGIFSTKLDTKN